MVKEGRAATLNKETMNGESIQAQNKVDLKVQTCPLSTQCERCVIPWPLSATEATDVLAVDTSLQGPKDKAR